MDLDQIRIAVRPRGPWEAMDLGVLLLRRYWPALYPPLLLVVLPLFVILHLSLPEDWLWTIPFIIWWLKPLYDRLLLHVLSRAIFGSTPTTGETLGALPQLLRSGLLAHLTLLRFDLARGFSLAVWQLEGIRGRARRERLRVLQQRSRVHAVWLTLVCLHFEALLTIGLSLLVIMFIPADIGFELWGPFIFEGSGFWTELITNGFYVLALLIIEPLYVGAGFALYLSRRTQLEGWDIELSLRRMARRLAAAGTAAVLGLALLLPTLLPGGAALADEPLGPQRTPGESSAVIAEVLAAEEFQDRRTETIWLPKERDPDEEETEDWAGFEWLETLGQLLAKLAEVLLWLALVAAIVIVVLTRRRWLPWLQGIKPPARGYRPPEVLFGLDLRPESLPEDVPAEALRLWRAGEARAALGLLYRASLAALVHEEAVELRPSHTEGDVLGLAEAALEPARAQYLGRLTRAWQQLAYAHRPPAPTEAEGLCGEWGERFSLREGQA
jgi:hypothetical protein